MSEKQATSLGATKNLLRLLKGNGFSVTRNPGVFAENLFNKIKGKKFAPPSVDAIKSQISEAGPAFLPKELGSTIYIPRKFDTPMVGLNHPSYVEQAGKARPQVKTVATPRESLFHEGGHAIHDIDDPGMQARTISRGHTINPNNQKAYNEYTNMLLAQERIANNNAINFMRANRAPSENIANYIRNADNQYGTYIDPDKFKGYMPGHSVGMLSKESAEKRSYLSPDFKKRVINILKNKLKDLKTYEGIV